MKRPTQTNSIISKYVIVAIKIIFDSLAYYCAVFIAVATYNSDIFGLSQSVWDNNALFIVFGQIVFLSVVWNSGSYRDFFDYARLSEMTRVLKASFQMLVLIVVLIFLFKLIVPRLLIVFFAISIIILPPLSRLFLCSLLKRYFSYPPKRKALVYGVGEIGKSFIKTLRQSNTTVDVVGFIDDDPELVKTELNPFPILGTLDDLDRLVVQFSIERIIVAVRHLSHKKMESLKVRAKQLKVNLSYVPRLEFLVQSPVKMRDFAGITLEPGVWHRNTPFYNSLKRVLDIIISTVVLVLFMPFFPIVLLLIKFETPGPVIFKHKRSGINGKHFTIYKLRTMYIDTDRYTHCPNSSDDVRITKVGKWLRKLSIDEIPQFYNVLKGNMSVVGPRPEMPFIVDEYNDIEKQRLSVKPGITGLWQISPTRNSEISHNLEYDFYYIENRSVALDIVIMFMTIFWVFRGHTH